tara:strand:- start:163 stop:354 length:192 start_codon:yes stop_codon:yes gene_type:complete
MNDVYMTELSLLYSQLPKYATDDELEMVEALAILVKEGDVSVWLDEESGQVLFQHKSQIDTTH